ncbi:hypothetical protein [Bacillus sp. FJAT-47783]|uniref:hypothetical protein n=1 Tax=Bacillus sp. FJAT-47783 TaxID=2922712 RepID=UPI001FAE6E4C|nr:hypothetical protein [Bacillus sp. FJAT-47783]
MNVFELLLDNPLLIAVLIGIVTSILGRKREKEKEEAPPKVKRASVQQTTNQKVEIQSVEEQKVVSEIEKRYEEIKNRNKEMPVNTRSIKIQSPSLKNKAVKKNRKPSLQSPVDGIIWSEILKEPRSKRPFNAYRRN